MRKFIITLSIILLASFGATQRVELSSMSINIGTKFTCSKSFNGDIPVIKAIGDVNGDTISDIAVGYSLQDTTTQEGIVGIIYGGANLPNGLDVCTFNDLSVGFRIKGIANDKLGTAITNMGDLNSDGLQDIAVGAAGHGGGFGRVYVIYMPAVSGRRSEYSISALNAYSLTNIVLNAGLGTYMADAVDYNGDTLKDVLIGNNAGDAHAYILFGQTAGSGDIQTDKLGPLAGVTLSPPTADTTFGQRPLASCLDFNQDTTADYVIPSNTTLYILYGNGSRAINEGVTVSNANGEVISLGGVLTMASTKSVTCVDLDMDGRQEVAISLSDNNVHVLYGSTIKGLSLTSVDAKTFNQGFTITEKASSTTFGNVLKRTDGWNGYGQDALLIADLGSSVVYSLYASSGSFNASSGMTSYVIENMFIPQSGFKVYTQDGTAKIGSSIDATFDINGDGIKDLLVSEGVSYNSYAFYGQCQSATGCACPNNLKYKNGQCVNWGLSGGQKVGIIVGVIIGAMLLIALGVLILKKTSCGANCFESYAKPAQFGSHTHAPIPQTMATSA